MPDPLANITAGQPFQPSARRENLVNAAARYVRDIAQRQGGGAIDSGSVEAGTTVTVKNTTGSDIARFGVLGISNALFTPTDNADLFASRVILQGTTPNELTHQGNFVVLAEPIRAGKIGRAYIAGIFPCKIDMTLSGHLFAAVKDGNTATLQSRGGGSACRILYKESGTGVVKAYVSMDLSGAFNYFPVTLSSTSGSNGTQTTQPSYVYSVLDNWTGNTIATGISPLNARINGSITAATRGTAFYEGSVLRLWETNEYPGTNTCP